MKIPALLLCTGLAGAACVAPHSGAHHPHSADKATNREDLADGSCYLPQFGAEHPRAVQKATNFKVLPLRFASAGDVAGTLHQLTKYMRIVPDARTNSLIISYESKEDLDQIEELVARLDVEVKPTK